jgi:transcriptional regulator
MVVEILSLRETKQSHQKIASFLAMTDWNNSPTRSREERAARGTPKK